MCLWRRGRSVRSSLGIFGCYDQGLLRRAEADMLDIQFVREHSAEVKVNCRNRNVRADVDRVVQLDDERKRLLQVTQGLQQRQNELNKLVPKEGDTAKKQALIQEGRGL